MRSRSLVARLALLVAVLLVVALGVAMATLSISFTREFVNEVEITNGERASAQDVADAILDSNVDARQDESRVRKIVDQISPGSSGYLVMDERFAVIWASSSLLEKAELDPHENGSVTLIANANVLEGGGRLEITTDRFAPVAFDDAGQPTVYLLLLQPAGPLPDGSAFAARAWANASAWLLASFLLSLAATWLVLRQSLRPIDGLTDAAKQLQRGSLPDPVSVPPIAEVRALFEAFNGAVETMRATDQLRQQMIADVAHELRTPVTNLRAQAEAFEAGLETDEKKFVEEILRETSLLERLFEDFQQLFLSEAGQLRVARSPVEVAGLSRAIFGALASANGFGVEYDLPEELWVTGDEERIQQVLQNLAENAMRHRRKGLVICIEQIRDPLPDGEVAIAIADNGPGIAPGAEKLIFERFYRGEISRAQDAAGAGLGLTITRSLMNAMGGEISVAPASSGGAEFILLFRAIAPISAK